MFSTYKFDQNKNYFIYVRDLTGKWTKYLLDTKGPRIEEYRNYHEIKRE